jgi:hypothetical protein
MRKERARTGRGKRAEMDDDHATVLGECHEWAETAACMHACLAVILLNTILKPSFFSRTSLANRQKLFLVVNDIIIILLLVPAFRLGVA